MLYNTIYDGTLLFGSSTPNCFVCLFVCFGWSGDGGIVTTSEALDAGRRLAIVSCWLPGWLHRVGHLSNADLVHVANSWEVFACLRWRRPSWLSLLYPSIHWRRRRRLIRFIAIIPFGPRIYRRCRIQQCSNPTLPQHILWKKKRRRRQTRNSIDKRIER